MRKKQGKTVYVSGRVMICALGSGGFLHGINEDFTGHIFDDEALFCRLLHYLLPCFLLVRNMSTRVVAETAFQQGMEEQPSYVFSSPHGLVKPQTEHTNPLKPFAEKKHVQRALRCCAMLPYALESGRLRGLTCSAEVKTRQRLHYHRMRFSSTPPQGIEKQPPLNV